MKWNTMTRSGNTKFQIVVLVRFHPNRNILNVMCVYIQRWKISLVWPLYIRVYLFEFLQQRLLNLRFKFQLIDFSTSDWICCTFVKLMMVTIKIIISAVIFDIRKTRHKIKSIRLFQFTLQQCMWPGFIRRGFCFQFLADSANKWWQTYYFATAHNEKPLKSNDSINLKFNRWQKRIRNTTEKDKKKWNRIDRISARDFSLCARAFKCFLFIWSILDGFFYCVNIFFKVNIAYLFVKHHVCANQIAKTEIYIENRTNKRSKRKNWSISHKAINQMKRAKKVFAIFPRISPTCMHELTLSI